MLKPTHKFTEAGLDCTKIRIEFTITRSNIVEAIGEILEQDQTLTVENIEEQLRWNMKDGGLQREGYYAENWKNETETKAKEIFEKLYAKWL